MITTHPKLLDELFKEINSAPDVLEALKDAFKLSYVKGYVKLAVDDAWIRLDIDKMDHEKYGYHVSMAGSMLLNRHTWTVIEKVLMNHDVSLHTATVQYKSLMSMLWEGEAKLLYAIFTKNVESIYPNITHALMVDALETSLV